MIKLDIKPNCINYFDRHLQILLRLESRLLELGIIFASPGDIMWVQGSKDEQYVEYLLDRNQPTILQDLYLGPEIYWWNLRAAICRDNVKAVVKTSKFVDPALYDIRFYEGMKHVTIIAKHPCVWHDTQISHLYHKIFVFANLIAWDHFQSPFPQLAQFSVDRQNKYDISMVIGDINHVYPVKEVRHHRHVALVVLHDLQDRYNVYFRLPPHDPPLGRTDYNDVLLSSMACLSPWGYDITCFRDFEAALMGAILVRPDTSWATSWPEIPYVACAVDFSDLGEIIERLRSDYRDYDDMRILARENAMLGRNNDVLAKRLAGLIKMCLE